MVWSLWCYVHDTKHLNVMNQFKKTTAQSEELFLPSLGVSKQTFEAIFNLVASHLQSIPDEQPMKKGGQKLPLRLPERLLFTFISLPHNPAFARLGLVFGFSESEANIYFSR